MSEEAALSTSETSEADIHESRDMELSRQAEDGADKGSGDADQPDVEPWRKVKHKIKDGDQELELDYDELKTRAQKASAADRRFEAARKAKREIAEIVQAASERPLDAAEKLGLKKAFAEKPQLLMDLVGPDVFKQVAEQVIWEDIQRQKMSPERRELEDLRRQKKEREEQERQRQEEEQLSRQRREQHEAMERYRAQYEEQFMGALKETDLPQTPETVARMSKLMMSALSNGYEPDMSEIVRQVDESYQREIDVFLSKLSPEQLRKRLGEEKIKQLQDYNLSQVRKRQPFSRAQDEPITRQDEGAGIPAEDFFAQARARLGIK